MAFEGKSAKQLAKWSEKADKIMTQKAKDSLTSHAIAGGILFALPMWGFETILYVAVLWHMYYKMAQHMKKSFGCGAILGGFFVNILVCLVVNLFSDVFLFVGWIISGIIGYFLTYYSGKSYLGMLSED